MNVKGFFTEADNATGCAIRVLGFFGVGLVGVGVVIGAAPAEIGLGVAAIIGAVGGGIRLKGDGKLDIDKR
jgi:hypothetical protein